MNDSFLLSLETPSAEIPSIPDGVCLHQFENGLTVIVAVDKSAPVVSAQAWCRAGSIDEGHWLGAGLSHVLEHMLFKGTKRRPSGGIDREVQEAGGYINAYTSFDRTVYWINVPNTGTRVALDVLTDITHEATLPADELAKEMDVIRREMDMGHDDPGRRSGRRLFETAYARSPYRYPVIGCREVFDRLEREDIVRYYRERYVPNNLFFVAVGDLDPDAVIDQIGEAFSDAPVRSLPTNAPPFEPRQMAPREVTEEAPIELSHAHYAWHIPDLRHPDVPRLDVLSVVLGGGRSSRLYQELRQKRGLVASVDAWTYSPGAAGLAGMSAILEADRFAAADEAVSQEVERLKTELISEAELGKATKQFIAANLGTRKTMQGQAQDLGANWMAAGDLNFSERYLAAVRASTPEDLRRVARTYFTRENRTRYTLAPKGAIARTNPVSRQREERPVRMLTLPNGLRVLHKEDTRLPFVEFRMILRGGILSETPQTNGITQLLARMLLQGTGARTADEIATGIESVGGSIDTYGGNNSFGVSAEVLREDYRLGLELVADVTLHPAFPLEGLEREKDIQLSAIRAQEDQMLQTAIRTVRRRLYGSRGYGLDLLGTPESVRALSTDCLRAAHRRLVLPDQCVLAIYGNVSESTVRTSTETVFEEWRTKPDDGRQRPGEMTTTDAELPDIPAANPDKRQAVVAIGFPGAVFDSKDRYALELIQEACSDLGSRLFRRIRDDLGLAYYVGAQNFVGLEPGYFAFYAGTAPEHATRVRDELLAEARALRDYGLSEDELRRAKAKIIGHKKIARQELGGVAMAAAIDELYGLGFAHIDQEDELLEAVALEEIREAAARYLRMDGLVEAFVGAAQA